MDLTLQPRAIFMFFYFLQIYVSYRFENILYKSITRGYSIRYKKKIGKVKEKEIFLFINVQLANNELPKLTEYVE